MHSPAPERSSPNQVAAGASVRMAVHHSVRRQGIGRHTVERLVARARQRRLNPLRVSTDTPSPEAVNLYASCGFRIVEQTASATNFEMIVDWKEHDPA